jgi:hypothetical protein
MRHEDSASGKSITREFFSKISTQGEGAKAFEPDGTKTGCARLPMFLASHAAKLEQEKS